MLGGQGSSRACWKCPRGSAGTRPPGAGAGLGAACGLCEAQPRSCPKLSFCPQPFLLSPSSPSVPAVP